MDDRTFLQLQNEINKKIACQYNIYFTRDSIWILKNYADPFSYNVYLEKYFPASKKNIKKIQSSTAKPYRIMVIFRCVHFSCIQALKSERCVFSVEKCSKLINLKASLLGKVSS